MTRESPVVGVVMGSASDWPLMRAAAEALQEFDIPHEVRLLSAHRMPHDTIEFAESAVGRGLKVVIAGAGGAAHLPGIVAALTPLPVIGVPISGKNLDGLDALLSIAQMPAGVPVATVGVDNARNAGLLAARVLGATDDALQAKVVSFQKGLAAAAKARESELS